MTYDASTDVQGVICTASITLPDNRKLKRDEEIRLKHHLDLVVNALRMRYVRHVATWGEQKIALMKLDETDAKVLGLHKDWLAANRPHAWGGTPTRKSDS